MPQCVFVMSVQCIQLVSLYLLSHVCFNDIHQYNLKTRDHYSLFRFHCEYDLSLAVSSLPLNLAPKSSYTAISCSKLFQSVVLLVLLGGKKYRSVDSSFCWIYSITLWIVSCTVYQVIDRAWNNSQCYRIDCCLEVHWVFGFDQSLGSYGCQKFICRDCSFCDGTYQSAVVHT